MRPVLDQAGVFIHVLFTAMASHIQKHADAEQVWLVLTVHDHSIALLISDDGQGLAGTEHTGFGLLGLRERAEQLDGELHLEPRSGGGTQFSFRLPLPMEVGDE